MIARDKQNELLTQAFKRLFETPDGKVLMKFLEDRCNVNRTTVCKQNPNLQQTLIEEGKRIVYLDIMWYLNESYKKKEEDES
jgi:hypothetical protein